jgi:hypothetical protein
LISPPDGPGHEEIQELSYQSHEVFGTGKANSSGRPSPQQEESVQVSGGPLQAFIDMKRLSQITVFHPVKDKDTNAKEVAERIGLVKLRSHLREAAGEGLIGQIPQDENLIDRIQ